MQNIVTSLGGPKHFAQVTKTAETSWDKFASFLMKVPPETEDKASLGWYCGAEFKPAYRDSKNFVARHCLTFDYDEIEEADLLKIFEAYAKCEYVLYTTASHTVEAPRIRMVFPLSRPCTVNEFSCLTRTVGAWFDLDKLARESDKPAQMMFLPSKKPNGIFWAKKNHGIVIDVDGELDEYEDWTDISKWPVRAGTDSIPRNDKPAAPDTKPGLVGDFCRAFSVTDAIEQFNLPYTASDGDESRWTYDAGSRPEGLRIYDGGLKAHSDHNTDPAHGQHNAFDLVRLHKFGDLDSDADRDKNITEHPSYKAMCEFARALPELNEFEDLDASLTDSTAALSSVQADEARSAHEPAPNRFKVIPAPEFALGTPPSWIIKGVLPKAQIAVVYGDAGTGKSFLLLDMCAAVVLGEPWRGHPVKGNRAVYVCAEGASGFQNRIDAYQRQNNVKLDDVGIVGVAPNIMEVKDDVALVRAVNEFGSVDIIVLDTLSTTMPGSDENTGKDMNRYITYCRKISDATNALVVLIHHSGKDTTKGARGWSGLRAAADAEIEITRNGDFRTATVTKMKDGVDGKQWSFKLAVIVLGIDEDGDEKTSCIIEHVDAAPVRNKRAQPQGVYSKNVLQVARRIMSSGEPMEVAKLIDKAAGNMPRTETGKRDLRKQNTSRAIKQLVVDEYLFLHGEDFISLTTAEPASDEDWMDE